MTIPRTAMATAALAVLGLTACGSDSGGSADSCEGLADDAIAIIQDVIDEVDGLSFEDMAAMGDEPAFLTDLEEQGTALEARQDEIGCSDEELEALLEPKLDELDVEPGSIGALMVDAIRTEGFDISDG